MKFKKHLGISQNSQNFLTKFKLKVKKDTSKIYDPNIFPCKKFVEKIQRVGWDCQPFYVMLARNFPYINLVQLVYILCLKARKKN